jgi:hypothetical protein
MIFFKKGDLYIACAESDVYDHRGNTIRVLPENSIMISIGISDEFNDYLVEIDGTIGYIHPTQLRAI